MKLSVCIPTYNRAEYIGEAIESVVRQATENVELVVSDNASTDDTERIVLSYQKRFSRIRYFKWDRNMGFNRNIAKVVGLAEGEYCWFVGSDDRISAGGVQTMLTALDAYSSLGGASYCTAGYSPDMRTRTPKWNPTLGKWRETHLFENANQCFQALGHYFGQFSGQLLNRKACLAVFERPEWPAICEGWGQVYLAAMVCKETQRWLYLDEECVDHRDHNTDHTFSNDPLAQWKFSISGSDQAFRAALGEGSPDYLSIMKTGVSVHLVHEIADAKEKRVMDLGCAYKLWRFCLPYYGRLPVFWLKAGPLMFLPRGLVMGSRAAYRAFKRRGAKGE